MFIICECNKNIIFKSNSVLNKKKKERKKEKKKRKENDSEKNEPFLIISTNFNETSMIQTHRK